MNKAYNYYRTLTDNDHSLSLRSGKKMQSYIENSEAIYHGIIVRSLYIPKIFTPDMAEIFDELTSTLCQILDKIITEYEKNPEYRKLFDFDKRLEELIESVSPTE